MKKLLLLFVALVAIEVSGYHTDFGDQKVNRPDTLPELFRAF